MRVPPVMEIVVSDQNIGSRRPAEWKASPSFPRRYPCNRLQQNAVLGRSRLLIFLPIWLLEKQNRQFGSFVYLEVWIEKIYTLHFQDSSEQNRRLIFLAACSKVVLHATKIAPSLMPEQPFSSSSCAFAAGTDIENE
jgi:hypothetical protein